MPDLVGCGEQGMVKEILLTLMPGIVSMLVWRRLHKEQVFSALDYLEGGTVFDLAVYLANVFLIWSRNWEYVDIAAKAGSRISRPYCGTVRRFLFDSWCHAGRVTFVLIRSLFFFIRNKSG